MDEIGYCVADLLNEVAHRGLMSPIIIRETTRREVYWNVTLSPFDEMVLRKLGYSVEKKDNGRFLVEIYPDQPVPKLDQGGE